jgi:hypothetical protein
MIWFILYLNKWTWILALLNQKELIFFFVVTDLSMYSANWLLWERYLNIWRSPKSVCAFVLNSNHERLILRSWTITIKNQILSFIPFLSHNCILEIADPCHHRFAFNSLVSQIRHLMRTVVHHIILILLIHLRLITMVLHYFHVMLWILVLVLINEVLWLFTRLTLKRLSLLHVHFIWLILLIDSLLRSIILKIMEVLLLNLLLTLET